jgi:glycolate oxidase FAD binding subunit
VITAASLRTELERLTGAGAIRPRTETTRWSVAGVEPAAVVQPATPEEVAAVLAFCTAEGIPVEPAGAGTWLAAARRPAAPPLVLSTARLQETVEYEPADLVVGVRAGMPHATLEALLATNRQMLPLDPPRAPGATVGATLALGAAGPLRAAHRTPRDLLLGIEVVTGDGRVLRFGGRVVKNVAGYDVVRLLAGSRGALGVITSAHLLLRSAPAVDRTFVSPAGAIADAAALALAIRDRIGGEAVEVLATTGSGFEDAAGGAAWAVLTRLRGSEAAVAEEAGRLADLAVAREVGRDVWGRLSGEEAAADTYLRLADRPVRLKRTLEQAAALGPPGSWRIAAHGSDGIVRMWRPPSAAPAAPELAGAIRSAAAALAADGGTLMCPVLPPDLRDAVDLPEAADAGVMGLMAALRRTFDPAGILSPGRHAF